MARAPSIAILGVRFSVLTPGEAVLAAEELYSDAQPRQIAYANAHTLNLAYADVGYRQVLREADLVLNDGKGVMIAARMLGNSFPHDLNGNFFTPLLLERAARRGWAVYLLGGKPGVAERAARRLQTRIAGLQVAGVADGYFSESGEDAVIRQINDSGAGLLLVALGNPKQEVWLNRNLDKTGARLAAGVGGFLDFQAGEVPRAPGWMRRLGVEWLHRLALEPKRMWRRYLIGNPLFLGRVVRQRLTGSVQTP